MHQSQPLKSHEIIIRRLRTLRPGEVFIYHVGFLESDRTRNLDGTISMIADAAYDCMCAGLIHLTQKRISPPKTKDGFIDWKEGNGSGFRYIATGAIPKPKKMPQFHPEIIGASS